MLASSGGKVSADSKLYLVVRGDLPPGLQAAQAAHAAQEFVFAHPERAKAWRVSSNTVVLVKVANECALLELGERAQDWGLCTVSFLDPDLTPALTAMALGPGPNVGRLCRKLPLVFGSG